MQTVQRPCVLRNSTSNFADLTRKQKQLTLFALVHHSRTFRYWDQKGRSSDWARVMTTFEDFICGSEFRYSVHE